jgi:outer membrane lipoprotein SlyB
MKTRYKLGSVLTLASVLTLGGCANMSDPFNPASHSGNTRDYGATPADSQYSGYGVVQSIERVQQTNDGIAGSGIGLGTVAGAVVGGIAGSQVGSGRGSTVATLIGTGGGAYLGHELENRYGRQNEEVYRITVRMENGTQQTLIQGTDVSFRVGDRVWVANGLAQHY